MARLLEKIFGTHSQHELKKIRPIADKVDALEDEYRKLSDKELRAKTAEFKQRYADGETLDSLLPEAFATMREAADRVLGMRHYRVQIIGGIVLHQGRIAEMKTGEGKTLVATLPVYLNALTGKGVHIVTVNDYLAKRDSEWMGKVYRFLGLKVGLIIHDIPPEDRKAMYEADITYGTNNEFGFDYLRDNMAIYKKDQVQRGHAFAVVDEVDSILIDEARTPLIISGQGDKSTDLYAQADAFVSRLRCYRIKEADAKIDVESEGERVLKELEEHEKDPSKHGPISEEDQKILAQLRADYVVDEKANTAMLSPNGQKKAEEYFHIDNLSDPENATLAHHINQAIRAHGVMKKDVDYVIRDNEIIIVDEFTGRLMFGRRYSDGLHQAIEAKEHVKVQRENKTLATITFQNYFRLYKKLSGMTGTALTEEDEFREIYSLDVVEIPTNRPIARIDNPDAVYRTEMGKYRAAVQKIKECNARQQPILVGTVSIEKSELLSKMLKREGIPHNVLNAKYHEQEAEIVAQAGKLGAVTIATNMAGRGTDIVLGGNAEQMAIEALRKKGYTEELIQEANGFAEVEDEEILAIRKEYRELLAKFKEQTSHDAELVRKAGGLCILGTERHESRRIDNQLRGRAGRQGDPGTSKFFLSMQDDLMRIFGSEKMSNVLQRLGLPEGEALVHPWISKALEKAQQKVEERNFDIRKNLLKYDNVMNEQRKIIYEQRREIMESEDLSDTIKEMRDEYLSGIIDAHVPYGTDASEWDKESLKQDLSAATGFVLPITNWCNEPELDSEGLKERILQEVDSRMAEREASLPADAVKMVQKSIFLQVLDQLWKDHIATLDLMRHTIVLRAYGQKEPLNEYKKEAFNMFSRMLDILKQRVTVVICHTFIQTDSQEQMQKAMDKEQNRPMSVVHEGDEPLKKLDPSMFVGISRNDPCPCGSGKKF